MNVLGAIVIIISVLHGVQPSAAHILLDIYLFVLSNVIELNRTEWMGWRVVMERKFVCLNDNDQQYPILN